MNYSIIIPVFNREDLTRNCLDTLPPTLEGAGTGEVIVVDNGSSAATAAILAQFPWVSVIRNERNLGFAAACNQGVRAARGDLICHLNNDIVAQPRWLALMIERLATDVGIVGARLLYPDNTIQHAGVAMYPVRFGPEAIGPYHLYGHWPRDTPATDEPADFQAVTGACLLTPRALFLELDGFDEIYWNGYEDVDYCFKVRKRGLRVVYEPRAILYHYESQSGVQRKRRITHNLRTLGNRWGQRVDPDHNRYWARNGFACREVFSENSRGMSLVTLPPTTVVIHGPPPEDVATFVDSLRDSRMKPKEIVWIAAGPAVVGTVVRYPGLDQVSAIRQMLEGRSDRYVAFVHTQTRLEPGWLDELACAVEYGSEVFSATVLPPVEQGTPVEPSASDARCALISLRDLPHHVRFGPVETVDAALVDLTWQAVSMGLGVRAVRPFIATLSAAVSDPLFTERHGIEHDMLRRADPERLESACKEKSDFKPFASIVMLSWNAPEYTQMAVESIRRYTRTPHEVILIDNGSRPETISVLKALTDVTFIFNDTNRGFAHACNQGIAAAKGTHVVLLNNDVIVTDAWLDNLLDAHRRDPLVGVSAPRSNRVVGHQQLPTVSYDSLDEMHEFASARARDFRGEHYRASRAIGFCLCISRAVIEEVGGIDTRYGVGNFEDDDFCIRVRAAGYQIAICEDAFIHHFGSVSFTTNNVDYSDQMQKNWQVFAQRWGFPATYPAEGYNSLLAIARGFDRERDYVALPVTETAAVPDNPADSQRSYETAFVALVNDETDWSKVGPLVLNYIKALRVEDSAVFSIGVSGQLDATTIGERISRSIARLQVAESRIADIEVVDVQDLDGWLSTIRANVLLRMVRDERLAALTFLRDRSPSGLGRAVRKKIL